MRTQQQDIGPRTVHGRVNADGTVAAGTEFRVRKTATGVYFLDFIPRFRSIPAIIATTRGAAVAQTEISVDTETPESVRLVTDGGATDNAFSFVAVGRLEPRRPTDA